VWFFITEYCYPFTSSVFASILAIIVKAKDARCPRKSQRLDLEALAEGFQDMAYEPGSRPVTVFA
jgi:hypothetical protein